MAPAREPRNPLEKRDLLHAEHPKTDRIDGIAEKLLGEGRAAEAVDYIEITRTPRLVARLAEVAKQTGSPFLMFQFERLSGEKATADDWRSISALSLKAGRNMDAVRALRNGGLEEEAEAVRLEHCPDFEPFRPQNK